MTNKAKKSDRNADDDESALRVARKCRADIDTMLRDVSQLLDSSKHALDVQKSTIAAMQCLFTALACRLPEAERNAIAADLSAEARKFLDPAPGIKVKPGEARAAGMLVDAANYITEIQAPEAEILSKLRNPPDNSGPDAAAAATESGEGPRPPDDPSSNVRRLR